MYKICKYYTLFILYYSYLVVKFFFIDWLIDLFIFLFYFILFYLFIYLFFLFYSYLVCLYDSFHFLCHVRFFSKKYNKASPSSSSESLTCNSTADTHGGVKTI